MIYTNPIIRGFNPDPSACAANGKFYLATSSFQYFPGVPIYESSDLVNWKQIGHALTRKSQVYLDKVRSSGGVFAPTLRYHEGRFYMITNNNSTNKNFYVYTDDIYGEWSEPIEVDQGGIDPSILFDNGKCYFISNGYDDDGVSGVIQCEIEIETGKKLTPSKCIWNGAGGRYLESPHMYKFGDYYYIMVAEGGTEYGHMVSYARGTNPWGPFENYKNNPVLTNRNKAPYIIQAIGHGDILEDNNGNFFMCALGFRQIDEWMPFHHLGRETFLIPVHFDEDGWFTCGNDGTCEFEYEIDGDFKQVYKNEYTFANTDFNLEWKYMRFHHPENYKLSETSVELTGTDITLDDIDSPTFIGMCQQDFNMEVTAKVTLSDTATSTPFYDESGVGGRECTKSEAGITVYMCEDEHYEVVLRKTAKAYEAVLKLNIGDIKHEQNKIDLPTNSATLIIKSDRLNYEFYVEAKGSQGEKKLTFLGKARTKYLSSEVSSGFTGTMVGLFATGDIKASFENFKLSYN